MKIVNSLASLMLACLLSAGFSACSSDDNGGLTTPAYESSAAKYDITTSSSPYSSIELTASGNYIIIESGVRSAYNVGRSASERKTGFGVFAKRANLSRSEFDGYKYGTYTKVGENQYKLSDFGTITIVTNGGNNYDLDIVRNNGTTMTLGANREKMYSSSEMTDKLCRTWRFKKFREREWENGKLVFDETYKPGDNEDDPLEVVFTKSGTYVVTYIDGTLDVSTWKWENENKGIVRYSWNLDDIDDPYESDTVSVKFSGNSCEVYAEEEDEDYKWSSITYMTAK